MLGKCATEKAFILKGLLPFSYLTIAWKLTIMGYMSGFSFNRTPEGWSKISKEETPQTPLRKRLMRADDKRPAALRHAEERTFTTQDRTARGLTDNAPVTSPRWKRKR